jgi:hypothetical protein
MTNGKSCIAEEKQKNKSSSFPINRKKDCMPTTVRVTRTLTVQALLDIEDPQFAHWYELGVWWALYGDQQGNGPLSDRYPIVAIQRGIASGWYTNLDSGWFPMIGFKLGMMHGGMLDPATKQLRSSASLVVLSDPDFTAGYHAGRRYRFFEGRDEPRLTDGSLSGFVNSWALEYHEWDEPEPTLHFAIGCRVGELSGQLIPMGKEERARIEAEDRRFVAEYEAKHFAPIIATV